MPRPAPETADAWLWLVAITLALVAVSGRARRWLAAHWPTFRAALARAALLTAAALVLVAGAVVALTTRAWRDSRGARASAWRATKRWATGAALLLAWSAVSAGRGGVQGARWTARHARHAAPRLLAVVVIPALVLVVPPALVFVRGTAAALTAGALGVPSGPLHLPPLAQRSVVYGADGSVLAVLHDDENRQPVPLTKVPPIVVNAVLDTEDDRFWHHGGVDGHALLRALTTDLRSGHAREGGSTIAQQLVKNTLLNPRHSLVRKVKEMFLAQRLERQLGKRALLERYLNTVYFGEGAYGVEAAAETYFGRSVDQLDAAQAALLAGIIRSPAAADPLRNPAAARARRATVLHLLVAHHHLSAAQAVAAGRAPLPTSVQSPPTVHDEFTDAVVQALLADRHLGATPDARRHALYAGGLRIHTTLDPALQHAAQAAVDAGLAPLPASLGAALAAVDPSSGAVRALVGGRTHVVGGFDPALSGRRPAGSAFKTFTLVAALQAGHRPDETIDGTAPCPVPNPGGTPDPWSPTNFEGEAFGPLSLTDATVHSVNCAYARLASSVGPSHIVDVAHAMGVTSPLATVPSITLGTSGVSPLDLADGYATLAADGIHHPAFLVSEVDRADGHVLDKHGGGGDRVLDPEVAREATSVLRQVIDHGTGTAANLGRPAAGKTGTAESYADAWFVGYTPQLATAVWLGNPAREQPMTGPDGRGIVGGSFPARIWHDFMAAALAAQPPTDFAAPVTPAPPAPGTPAGGPNATTWCWASCGKGGQPQPAVAVTRAPKPPRDARHR